MAVAGLPEPRRDHAVAMAKFAFDCLKKVGDVTKKLEVALGPDTADLTVRVGLHVSTPLFPPTFQKFCSEPTLTLCRPLHAVRSSHCRCPSRKYGVGWYRIRAIVRSWRISLWFEHFREKNRGFNCSETQ